MRRETTILLRQPRRKINKIGEDTLTEKFEPSAEDRKKFAQSQLQFLKEKGINSSLRLSRIFKAAGPGQVQEAWALSEQATTSVKKDLLDCILTGVGGSQDLSRSRMETVLRTAGFTPPNLPSDRAFFRALDGAMEILVPGSYEFTPEELDEIEAGLERSKDKYEQLVKSKECSAE